MKYVLTFAPKTAGYRCHAATCSQAATNRNANRLPGEFTSIENARAVADEDEQGKGGERADFKVCGCAK